MAEILPMLPYMLGLLAAAAAAKHISK